MTLLFWWGMKLKEMKDTCHGTQLGKGGGGIEILGTEVHAVGHSTTGLLTHSYPSRPALYDHPALKKCPNYSIAYGVVEQWLKELRIWGPASNFYPTTSYPYGLGQVT